jgi:hypothetical protein
MGIRRYQQNELLEAIQEARLAPEEFDLNIGDDKSTLTHLPTGANFVLSGIGRYSVRRVAGDGPAEERERLSWYAVKEQVALWLIDVKFDVGTPDLWAQLEGERKLLEAISDDSVENRPFTEAEQKQVAEQLQELRSYVRDAHSLSDAQVRLLDEKLDYLVDATSRAGRRDWLLMLAGVMLSYVLAADLPGEAARDILGTFLKGIARIVGLDFPELGGG